MWNYRVVRIENEWLEIHEVYYRHVDGGENYDNIRAWTECSVSVSGENVDSMESTLTMMRAALAKPILDLAVLMGCISS